jgi:hypothetical protein
VSLLKNANASGSAQGIKVHLQEGIRQNRITNIAVGMPGRTYPQIGSGPPLRCIVFTTLETEPLAYSSSGG